MLWPAALSWRGIMPGGSGRHETRVESRIALGIGSRCPLDLGVFLSIWTDPERTKSVMVRTLYDWWSANAGSAGIPDRSAFDPIEHRLLMPNVMITEVETEPFRLRYRLVGTRVVANLGTDFTGRYLDELIGPDFKVPWLDYYRQAYAERRPLMGALTEPTKTGNTFTYEFGLFPVARSGTEVKQFIALEDYFDFKLTSGALAGL